MNWRLIACWLALEASGMAAATADPANPAAGVVLSLAVILLAAKVGGLDMPEMGGSGYHGEGKEAL